MYYFFYLQLALHSLHNKQQQALADDTGLVANEEIDEAMDVRCDASSGELSPIDPSSNYEEEEVDSSDNEMDVESQLTQAIDFIAAEDFTVQSEFIASSSAPSAHPSLPVLAEVIAEEAITTEMVTILYNFYLFLVLIYVLIIIGCQHRVRGGR